jgi:hypothetical protein
MKRTSPPSRESSPHRSEQSAQSCSELRTQKLAEFLKGTPAIENGLTLPESPRRFVALEQSVFGDTLWAYFDDLMTGMMEQLERSDTSFVDRIRVHDLDTGLIYAPKWKLDSLYGVPR